MPAARSPASVVGMPNHQPRHRQGLLWAAATLVAVSAGGAVALLTADGLPAGAPVSDSTQFVEPTLWGWTLQLALLPVAVAAWRWMVAGVLADLGLLAGAWWVTWVAVERYGAAGCVEPLLVLAYAVPVLQAAVGLLVVLLAGLAGLTWRRRRGPVHAPAVA